MIKEKLIPKLSTIRWFWVLTIVTSLLIGLGIGQLVQFHGATAEAQDDGLSQFAEDLAALKDEHKRIQTKWQSGLFVQIVPTLKDESEAVRRRFVDFLEEIGNSGTAALIALLQDPSKRIRENAVEALGEIGEDERKAGRNYDAAAIGLAGALTDASEDVYGEAVAELGDLRPTSAESLTFVVPALIAAQTKGSSSTRDDVLDVLGQIGEDLAEKGRSTDTIRDALIAGLNDDSSKVRTNAIAELSDIRAASTETFAALTQALSDASKTVRNRAEDALIKLGRGHAVTLTPLLTDVLTNQQSVSARGHAVDVLGEIGEDLIKKGDSGEIVVKPLITALQDTEADVRRNAADELGEMQAKAPGVLTALNRALKDSSKSVRNAAQKAIQRIEKSK